MTQPAITVENLGKMYRLSHTLKRTDSFRDAITSAAMAPLRRLRQLSGRDDSEEEFWALKDISFEIMPGEVVGIIGRNGAGKSTLLKILSRIVEPTEGLAQLRGRVSSLLEVGTGFHPELTGRENIYLNGSILGMSKQEISTKYSEIVAFAEIEKFLDTPVKRYSSGMYVRLAFAVAAHLEPEILIVDEVLAVGDAEFQQKCLGKMSDVTKEGRTILFVSHNMAAVRSLCTQAIHLRGGRLVAKGLSSAVIDEYLHPATDRADATIGMTRPTGAPVWMSNACLMGTVGPTLTIAMGEPLTLHVSFCADPPTNLPQIGFVITSTDGTRLLCANNRYQQGDRPTHRMSRGTLICDLGAVPLMPGRYVVSLYLGDHSRDWHVAQDAIPFSVIERDIWGLGKLPPSNVSQMWWPTTFSVHDPHDLPATDRTVTTSS